MRFEIITSPGIAHNSYFFANNGEACVIDPRRDAQIYIDLAKQECAEILYIFETHRNEDYVIGSLELQNLTGAEIGHSQYTPFKYGEYRVKDGDTFNISHFRIEALYTPGHTNDCICYALTDTATSKRPFMVFTGDTLFIGDIGRTDLPGLDIWEEMTEKQYHSLHEKLLPLGDDVLIYPAHGAGSICGHKLSDRNFSTIGYEQTHNPVLQLEKEAFIEHILSIKLRRPPYFRKMEEYNLVGPPLLRDAPVPKALSVNQFKKALENPNTIVVDTRNPDAYAASHLAGSLSIWLRGLSFYPGWVITHDQQLVLIVERPEDMGVVKPYLWRLGYDNIIGYLCPGIEAWRNKGNPTDQFGTITTQQLKEKLEKNEIVLIDVRSTAECESGFVEGSKYIYVGELARHLDKIPRDKPLAIACATGLRGSLAASILRKHGFNDISNVLGGLKAWVALGYPMVQECPAII
ncbi:MAG: rhodanese-like domain-containing protein [Promethearchaeota archaeon]